MALKYRAYWKWWKTGAARVRFGGAPLRILTLTSSTRRLQSLRESATRAPEGKPGSALFWFAEVENVDIAEPERMLGRVWQTAMPGPGVRKPLISN